MHARNCAFYFNVNYVIVLLIPSDVCILAILIISLGLAGSYLISSLFCPLRFDEKLVGFSHYGVLIENEKHANILCIYQGTSSM